MYRKSRKSRNSRNIAVGAAVTLALGLAACGGTGEAEYPSESIELTVGFGAGGALDLVARKLADNMEEPFDFTVLNREGAGGTIAASEVINSDPDGYTAYLASTTIMTAQPHRVDDLSYGDPSTYTPTARVVSFPQVLAVQDDAPYESLADIITAASSDPSSMQIGTGGEGTIGHLTLEMVVDEGGLSYTHVPFQGFSQSVPALLGGQVVAIMATPADVLPHIRSGDMKAVAVFSEERTDSLPDTPTALEVGVDVVQDNYYFVILPPGVEESVVTALGEAILSAVDRPEFRQLAEESGARIDPADRAELTTQLENDYEKFGNIVERLGLG